MSTPGVPMRSRPGYNTVTMIMAAGLLVLVAYFVYHITQAATPPIAQPTPPAAPSSNLKPQISGVIDRNGPASGGFAQTVNGYVVQAKWSDLQPTQAGPIKTGNVIDQALNYVRQQNLSNPGLNLSLKLRVYAGDDAPAWAKNIGGAPFTIKNDQGQQVVSGKIGRFWLPAYGVAYQDLQNKLAALYDNVPEIKEVQISRCTTLYAEPFIREANISSNAAAYRKAGYTVSADQQCQKEEVDAHQVWQHTRSAIDLFPFQEILPKSTDINESFTEQMMAYCRQSLGQRCVLGYNGLKDSQQSPDIEQMLRRIGSLGKPVYFQTASLDKIGNWQNTINKGLGDGAGMIELPTGYNKFTLSQLAGFDQRLQSQAQQ